MAMTLAKNISDWLDPAAFRPPVPTAFVDVFNRQFLRELLSAQRQGRNVLPVQLGLSAEHYRRLLLRHFPGESLWFDSERAPGAANGLLRQELLELRRDECQQVENLLLAHRNGFSALEVPMAAIVAAGCLGGDHLWRDLGLRSRHELRILLDVNFRALVAKNSGDMKWKKFFYKQLCEQEGGYVCRAPSCAQCAVYSDCFGPEE